MAQVSEALIRVQGTEPAELTCPPNEYNPSYLKDQPNQESFPRNTPTDKTRGILKTTHFRALIIRPPVFKAGPP